MIGFTATFTGTVYNQTLPRFCRIPPQVGPPGRGPLDAAMQDFDAAGASRLQPRALLHSEPEFDENLGTGICNVARALVSRGI